MNTQQVGQFVAVSALTGLATRYVMNRYLSNLMTEKTRNIASLVIGLGCGFATRSSSIKTLLGAMGISIAQIFCSQLTEDQIAYNKLKNND